MATTFCDAEVWRMEGWILVKGEGGEGRGEGVHKAFQCMETGHKLTSWSWSCVCVCVVSSLSLLVSGEMIWSLAMMTMMGADTAAGDKQPRQGRPRRDNMRTEGGAAGVWCVLCGCEIFWEIQEGDMDEEVGSRK